MAYKMECTTANDELLYRRSNPLFVFKKMTTSKPNTTRKQTQANVSGVCKPISKRNHESHFNIPFESSKIGIAKGDINIQEREACVKVVDNQIYKENQLPDEVNNNLAMAGPGELIQEIHTIMIAPCDHGYEERLERTKKCEESLYKRQARKTLEDTTHRGSPKKVYPKEMHVHSPEAPLYKRQARKTLENKTHRGSPKKVYPKEKHVRSPEMPFTKESIVPYTSHDM